MLGIVPIHFPKKKTLFPPEVDQSDFEECRERVARYPTDALLLYAMG